MAFALVSPEFNDSTKIELADHIMWLDESVHVSFETMLCVNTLLVKFYLDEAVRVSSDDEIYLSPVNHDNLFNIIHNIW